MRVRRFDRRLLRGLLDALEHRLQQAAGCVRVAQHRVERHLCLRVDRHLRLLIAQVALQRLHALAVGADIGIDRGHDPADLGCDGTVHIGKLRTDRHDIRVAGAQAPLHRLQLRRQLIMAYAERRHGRRDRRLCGSADAASRGIQFALGFGERVAGARQVLGQQADLLAVEPRVHALDQAVLGPVAGDIVLLPPHIPAQFLAPLLQPFARLGDSAVFRAELGFHIDIHRDVHRRSGDHRVFSAERYLEDMRRLHRRHGQRGLHGTESGVACTAQRGPGQLAGRRRRGFGHHSPERGQHSFRPRPRAQGRIEFRVGLQVQPTGHLLDHRHAAQHLGLARHHRIGDGVDPQDALHLAQLVLARVVEQRAGGGIARRELCDRDKGQQRAQQDRCQQEPLAASQDGEDGGAVQCRRIADIDRHARGGTVAPDRPGRLGCSFWSVEHRLSCRCRPV